MIGPTYMNSVRFQDGITYGLARNHIAWESGGIGRLMALV